LKALARQQVAPISVTDKKEFLSRAFAVVDFQRRQTTTYCDGRKLLKKE